KTGRDTPLPLYAVLLRTGFGEPTPSPAPLVSSYLTVSPLPAAAALLAQRAARWRSALCSTFRGLTPPGGYPASCPVEFGLSSRSGLGRSDFERRRHAPRSEERRVGKECRSRWSP